METRYKSYFKEQEAPIIPHDFIFIKNSHFNKLPNNFVYHITSKKYAKNILSSGLISGYSRGFYKKSISPNDVWFWNDSDFEDIFNKFRDQSNRKEAIVIISLQDLYFILDTFKTTGFVKDSIPTENIYGVCYLR